MIGWDDDDDELRPMFNGGYGLYDDHSYTSFINYNDNNRDLRKTSKWNKVVSTSAGKKRDDIYVCMHIIILL